MLVHCAQTAVQIAPKPKAKVFRLSSLPPLVHYIWDLKYCYHIFVCAHLWGIKSNMLTNTHSPFGLLQLLDFCQWQPPPLWWIILPGHSYEQPIFKVWLYSCYLFTSVLFFFVTMLINSVGTTEKMLRETVYWLLTERLCTKYCVYHFTVFDANTKYFHFCLKNSCNYVI